MKKSVVTLSKLIIQLWLFGLFLHLFGLPALKRFQDKKVVVVTSSKDAGGTPIPAVTIVVRGNDTKTETGWKNKKGISDFVRRNCNEALAMNTTETINDCIESQTYDISEVVKNVRFGIG